MKIGVGGTNRNVVNNKIGISGAWRSIKEIKMGVANAWRSVWKRAVELIRTFTSKADFDTCALTDTVATEAGDVELGVLEGTTNLLTANQSSAETNLTGFAKNAYPSSETLTRDTVEHWHGSACLKLVVPGTSLSEGLYATCSVTSGQTYTFSVYLKGSGKVWVGLGGKFSVNNNSVNNIELTNEWKRYNVTDTANGSGTANLYIIAEDDNTADTIYIDGLQLEQKDHVCPWTLGGTTSQNMYELTGTIESPAIDLSSAIEAETSEIEFSTTTPTGTTATVQTALSTDGGTTYGSWQTATSGAAIPGLRVIADEDYGKLDDPADLPTGTGYGCAFSSDGTYLAIAYYTSPYLTIYKRSGDTFTKLADPEDLPTGYGYGVAFSSDGIYLAVAHGASPFITIYKRSGDTFTKIADPEDLPTGTGNGCTFSPDGTYLAVAHNASPYLTIYKRSGDTFTKLADPEDLPTGYGYGVAFSSDGIYLAVAHLYSPYLTIYKRSGDTFTKLTNPEDLPTGTGRGCAFSSDGTYLSVAHTTSPYLTIYKRSGDTFTKIADPEDLPTGTGYGAVFSPDGTYLSVAHTTSPYLTIYKRSGDTFTKIADPEDLPTGTGYGAVFSPDGTYLAVAHNASPYITIYKITSSYGSIDISTARLKWKVTLGTNDASVTPKLSEVTVKLNEGM